MQREDEKRLLREFEGRMWTRRFRASLQSNPQDTQSGPLMAFRTLIVSDTGDRNSTMKALAEFFGEDLEPPDVEDEGDGTDSERGLYKMLQEVTLSETSTVVSADQSPVINQPAPLSASTAGSFPIEEIGNSGPETEAKITPPSESWATWAAYNHMDKGDSAAFIRHVETRNSFLCLIGEPGRELVSFTFFRNPKDTQISTSGYICDREELASHLKYGSRNPVHDSEWGVWQELKETPVTHVRELVSSVISWVDPVMSVRVGESQSERDALVSSAMDPQSDSPSVPHSMIYAPLHTIPEVLYKEAMELYIEGWKEATNTAMLELIQGISLGDNPPETFAGSEANTKDEVEGGPSTAQEEDPGSRTLVESSSATEHADDETDEKTPLLSD